MQQLTAAHRTLPFQTWVEVTNLSNGKQVSVRINDRGPFIDGRIIDLSMAAARAIDMLRAGVAPVRLRIIDPPAEPPAAEPPAIPQALPEVAAQPPSPSYAVQAGAFADRQRAENLRESLPFPAARVVPSTEAPSGVPPFWRVLVGTGLNMDAAAALAAEVKEIAGDSLVVREE